MGITPLDVAAGQVSASCMLILPIMLLGDQPWTLPATPSFATWTALAEPGRLSTALAYFLYFRILAVAGATNLLPVTLLIPVTAVRFGWLFLGEGLENRQVAGMVLIAASLALVDGQLLKLRQVAK
jgi:drug/metabolite transporter (DMT)-like permease